MKTGFTVKQAGPKGHVQVGDTYVDLQSERSCSIGQSWLTPAGRTLIGPVLATVKVISIIPSDINGLVYAECKVISV